MNGDTIKLIDEHKLVALIRTSTPEDSEALTQALYDGGIRVFAVAVNIPQAPRLIESLSKKDGVVAGAASVMDGEIAQKCINAGARFISSPVTDRDVIYVGRNSDVTVIQGALTPTEIIDAVKLGVDIVSVYPADLLGGPAYLKSLRGAFPSVKLLPTGGVTCENAVEYLKLGAAAVLLGNGVLEKSLIRANSWDVLKDRARQLIEKIESLKAVK
ncbi:MAG: bifunctional 4-hydroxy-2-oxoglutarate aldolase/2-dehydro-3-deoxy-phosphogluconate aldolase [Candidatus Omnitrophica bacterium]|nr:bifunctional 4-hydroxy-2-oxoglutarate aldolase/2-dehydro-3-deoxy-phosphogluconate aldolase [Candidatus Omnitrophota bacterium]